MGCLITADCEVQRMAYEIEQYLNVRSASAPSYSPDGQRIASVSNLTGIPLPWVVPASGGWPHPLSLATERTGQVVFSPSGQHVAFDRDHGGDEHWQLLVCNPEGGGVRPFTFDPDVSHRFGQWARRRVDHRPGGQPSGDNPHRGADDQRGLGRGRLEDLVRHNLRFPVPHPDESRRNRRARQRLDYWLSTKTEVK